MELKFPGAEHPFCSPDLPLITKLMLPQSSWSQKDSLAPGEWVAYTYECYAKEIVHHLKGNIFCNR